MKRILTFIGAVAALAESHPKQPGRNRINYLLAAALALLVTFGGTRSAAAQTTPLPACVEPPSGLVSWWRAEGNALDSGDTNDGTLLNGTAFQPGEVGQAFSFDGVDDYVEVPDDPSLRIGDVITIEFWAKRRRFGIDIVVEKGGDWNVAVGDPGANYGVGLHYVNNNMFYFTFKAGWRGCDGVADFDWHHYAVVAIQGQPTATFYIDGVQRPSLYAGGVSSIDLNAANTLPLYIGAQANDPRGFDYYGNNVIDELSIYHRALTTAEIQAIYNAGAAGKCLGTADTTPPTITCPPDVTVASYADIPPADFAGGSVSDGQDPNPTVTWEGDVLSNSCPMIIVRTYKATDASGNSATCDQIIIANNLFAPDGIIWHQPLARNGTSEDTDPSAGGTLKYRFKLGSTIPIKIHVLDCDGSDVTDNSDVVGIVDVFPDANCEAASDGNAEVIDYNGVGGAGGLMDKVDGHLMYNLDTSLLPQTTSCYILQVTVGDISTGEYISETVPLQAK